MWPVEANRDVTKLKMTIQQVVVRGRKKMHGYALEENKQNRVELTEWENADVLWGGDEENRRVRH